MIGSQLRCEGPWRNLASHGHEKDEPTGIGCARAQEVAPERVFRAWRVGPDVLDVSVHGFLATPLSVDVPADRWLCVLTSQ